MLNWSSVSQYVSCVTFCWRNCPEILYLHQASLQHNNLWYSYQESTWPLHNQHPPPHNPTTMKKMILVHREAGGLVQPISTHRRRGSAVIYMLMVSVEAMEMGPGQGATLWCTLRMFLRVHSAAQTNPVVWKPSAGPHLVQPAGPFTHCLSRFVCWTLLLLFFSGTQTPPGLFSNTN